jgi:hypothetical protein
LFAGDRVTQLHEFHVPTGFANDLEFSIRTRIRSINEQHHRDVSPARSLVVIGQNRWDIQPTQAGNSYNSQRKYKRRTWMTLLRIAAVFLIAGIGVLTASARSLPGDALYSLNQAEKQFAFTFAGAPQNRADLQIAHLRSAIVDLNTVVKSGRDDDSIRMALDTVSAKTIDSQEAVAALPANSLRGEAQQGLSSALAEEEQVLRQLLNNVDWPIRLAFTQQLGALGEQVPTLTHVLIRTQSNGTLLITLSGSYFSSQTLLMINGQQTGIVKQITPSQIVAVSNNVGVFSSTFAVGVRDPDGMAAQLIINAVDDNAGSQDDNHSRSGTPVPSPTRRPDE